MRPRPAAASIEGNGFAVGGNFQNLPGGEAQRDFDAMRASGARWIRMDINWAVIQRDGPASFDWTNFDRVAAQATARGFQILGVILYTPSWARPAGGNARTPPADLNAYAKFVATAVAHYSLLGVHAYEIWNEPNLASFWQPRADPARYAAMLRGAYAAVKRVDATATVVSGGLSPATDSGGSVAPITFLKGLYTNGAKGSFDALGHHPYCWPAYPGETQSWSAWYQMDAPRTSLRSVMEANGDGAKKIWATEFGAPTRGANAVSESQQADMLARALTVFHSYSWAGPIFWYSQRDLGTSPSSREESFGILRNDFSPKPAFNVLRSISVH
jgi:polysaccharide biosynthesis protein PslG